MNDSSAVYRILPERMKSLISEKDIRLELFEEIRIRRDRPVVFLAGSYEKCIFSSLILNAEEMHRLLILACRYSLYAEREQLKDGYITITGGHRIGVAGELVSRNGTIEEIRNISSFNIRIAHEVIGCARGVFPYLTDGTRFMNTLILSPPGMGKTTLLRDIVRTLSEGSRWLLPQQVGLADERSEVAACLEGVPQNDIGRNTDVMDRGSKLSAMRMLLRTMNPQILASDELGGENERKLLCEACSWGVSAVTTFHGKMNMRIMIERGFAGIFERYIEIGQNRVYTVFDEAGELIASIRGGVK